MSNQVITFQEWIELKSKKKKNKFNAIRSGGFASGLEHAVHQMLTIMQRAGEITDLKCQETVWLTRARIQYRVDFTYVKKGVKVYVEAKGVETEGWLIKKKLWYVYGPGPLQIWRGGKTIQSLWMEPEIIPS